MPESTEPDACAICKKAFPVGEVFTSWGRIANYAWAVPSTGLCPTKGGCPTETDLPGESKTRTG